MKQIFLIAAPLLFLGCSPNPGHVVDEQSVFATAVPICTIVANPKTYDGQEILVNALYRLEPHGPVLIGRSCSEEEIRMRPAVGYSENERAKRTIELSIGKDETKPVDVIYRGVFRIVHGFSCTAVTCFRYEIETSELVAARSTNR